MMMQDVVQEVFPGCTLEIFGSFATGLHLPTSDVDCVILHSGIADRQVPTALQGLGRKLQQMDWVTNLEVWPCITHLHKLVRVLRALCVSGNVNSFMHTCEHVCACTQIICGASAGGSQGKGANCKAGHHALRPQV